MSGTGFHFQLEGLAAVQSYLEQISDSDRSELMESIAAEGEQQTRRRIKEDKSTPEGFAWYELSPEYAERKSRFSSGGILEYEGFLEQTISSAADSGNAWWGSDRVYAAAQQFGISGRLPARPYLGLSSANMADIQQIASAWLEALS